LRVENGAVALNIDDIGHLLSGVGDADHAEAGGAALWAALGQRVAELVGLHVEAKRYLVARRLDPGHPEVGRHAGVITARVTRV
jgi:predicted HD phosphohydrolase